MNFSIKSGSSKAGGKSLSFGFAKGAKPKVSKAKASMCGLKAAAKG